MQHSARDIPYREPPMTPFIIALIACTDKSDDSQPGEGDTSADSANPSDTVPSQLQCPADEDGRFATLATVIDSERAALGAPGMAVAIVEDGAVVWCRGFGDKHPSEGGAVLPSTLFRMGSVNKMMTAVGVLQQVDSGAVALTDPATTPLPDFSLQYSPDYTDITVEHLLTHQGGFYDYLLIDDDDDDDALAEAVEGWFSTNEVLISPPGAFWNYSNPNWYVAGRIVEKLDGRYYTQYMADEVFEPLWMNRTTFDGEAVLADGDYASGKTSDWTGSSSDSAIAGPDSYDNAWARPAGYAWTSAEELARFAVFMMNGDETVLSSALREQMMTERVDLSYAPDLQYYGYGLFTDPGVFFDADDYRPLNLVYHGGDINGFAADLFMVPEQNFAMAILANADNAHVSDSLLAALDLVVNMPDSTEVPDLSPVSDVTAMAGNYSEPWNIVGDFTLTEAEGVLSVEMPALDKHGFSYSTTLTPYIDRTFVFTVAGYSDLMTFIEVDGVMYARTRLFVGAQTAQAGMAPPAARPFDAERLRRALKAPGPALRLP